MKGTQADGAINRLFCGKMKSYIKCIDIDFESARSEEFYGALPSSCSCSSSRILLAVVAAGVAPVSHLGSVKS